MGLLETVFGIQIGKKHKDNYYEWFKLLARDIKVTYNGTSQIIASENYEIKMIEEYMEETKKGKCIIGLNTYDDVLTDTKELDGEESIYEFFYGIQSVSPSGIKFTASKHVCVDSIGWSHGGDEDEIIKADELEQLVKLREKLISQHRLSENSNITYTSNCSS